MQCVKNDGRLCCSYFPYVQGSTFEQKASFKTGEYMLRLLPQHSSHLRIGGGKTLLERGRRNGYSLSFFVNVRAIILGITFSKVITLCSNFGMVKQILACKNRVCLPFSHIVWLYWAGKNGTSKIKEIRTHLTLKNVSSCAHMFRIWD